MSTPSGDEDARVTPPVPGHILEQIELLTELRARSEQRVGRHQRAIESVTAALGQPATLYTILAVVVVWSVANTFAASSAFDAPPFQWLQGLVSLYAALASTVVIITQNRQNKHAEHRAYLELQVNLLAEQKAGKIISLLEELRRDLPAVRDRVDAEANALAHAVNPKAILSILEDSLEEAVQSPSTLASSPGAEPRET